MRERLLTMQPALCIERARYLTESFKETECEVMVLRRAKALQNILNNMSVNIWQGEHIVGSATSKEAGGNFYPDCNGRIWGELESLPKRDTNSFLIDPVDIDEIRSDIIPYWSGKTIEESARKLWSADLDRRVNVLGSGMVLTEVAGLGHVLLNHSKVVRIGLRGIIDEIENRLRGSDVDTGRRAFYEAARISCTAVIEFAHRYADRAEQLAAQERDGERRSELEEIARICRRVPAEPARTFHEGLQSIYFIHLAAQIEDYEKSISFGGIDRYLFPLYEGDLLANRINRERAQTLLECFFIKLNSTTPCFDFAGDLAFSSIQSATNLIVGGCDANGDDIVNELSFIAVDAREKVAMHEPNFGVRVHRNTDPAFIRRIAQSAATGRGHLQIFNDDVIISVLTEWGIPREDAAEYGIIGCVELGVPGKTCNSANAALLDLAYCLELALNRGRKLSDNMLSPFQGGQQLGPETVDPAEMKSIDDLLAAFEQQVSFQVQKMVEGMEVLAQTHAEQRPLTFISSLTEDCLEKGKDIMWGGARYNYTAIQGIGLATVGDSLAAIERTVFQEKRISLEELRDVLSRNFEGDEPLRQHLLHRCPKFGNDDGGADRWTQEVADIFCEEVRRHPSYRGGRYQPGFFSSNGHIAFGITDAASPSGRRAGEPLSVGVSPAQGMNRSSPTAALNSASRIDYSKVTNGAALNLEFSPSFFKGEKGEEDFKSLLTVFFDQGGMHLQCNILDRDILIKAKEHPEQYRDLLVRPAGFSICFVNLSPLSQDELISRTRY